MNVLGINLFKQNGPDGVLGQMGCFILAFLQLQDSLTGISV